MSRSKMMKSTAPALLAVLLAAAPLMAQSPELPAAPEDLRLQVEPGAVDAPRGDLFIRGLDSVWTATGEILENASILIRDGRIEAIGPDIGAPGGVEVIEGSGYTAIPGIVDEHSHIAMESTNEGSAPVVPEVRVIDALDAEDFGIYRALSGGVTTAQILHGSANPIGGQSAIIKTRWGMEDSDRLLVGGAPQTVKFALGENVTRKNWNRSPARFPGSRAGVEQVYVQAFTAAQEYQRAWEEYRDDPGSFAVPPRRDLRLEALVDIMEGRIRVHAHSYRGDEIVMLMRIAEQFGFRIDAFTHVLEGYKVADELAAHGAGASTFSDWWHYKTEAFDAIPYNAAIMHEHGVLTSLNSDIPWLQTFMVYEMNKPVKYGGVSKQDALRMLTMNPAMQLRLEDRIGSLEVGKDGDVVLLSGDPFDVYSRVEKTIVDGIVYYDLERDSELRDAPVRERTVVRTTVASRGSGGSAAGGSDAASAVNGRDAGASDTVGPETSPAAGGPSSEGGSAVSAEALPRAGGSVAPVALVGATVHPVSGPDIPDGVVVIDENGRIAAVGPAASVEIPAGVRNIDLSGKHLYPGMIDPMTQLGMVDVGSVASAQDSREVGTYNPHVRALTSIHPPSEPIPVARANGITAAMAAHTSGVIQGTGSVIQLTGDTPERMEIEDRAALVVNFPSADGEDWEEPKLEGERLEELVDFFERSRLYAAEPTTRDRPTDRFDVQTAGGEAVLLDAMLPAIRGEMPVFFRVREERDIRTLLLFLDRFPDVRAVVLGGDQAFRIADELAERDIAVIVGSGLSPTMDRYDPIEAGWRNAAVLHGAGVPIAFSTQDVADVRNLPYHAARSAAFGLPREVAIRGVTLGAAEVLGLGSEMGSIDEGKRADLIVTDGDPLQILTHVERMFIGGEEVSLESRHTRLYDEFIDRH